MNTLVIGGTGFIGTRLCEKLVGEGNEVRVFDLNIPEGKEKLKKVSYIKGNFANINNYSEIFNGIDIVYHLVSTTIPATSNKDRLFDIESNVCNTIKLLDIVITTQVKKLIFLSSGGTVYGEVKSDFISEDNPTNPICSYGIQKLTIEKYLQYYNHEFNLDYAIIRLSNPYGIRNNNNKQQGVIPIFIDKICNNEKITIWGDGNIVRDYIYIDDAVDVLIKIKDYVGKYKIFNLGTGKGYSLNEVIRIIENILNKKANIEKQYGRTIDVRRNVLNINRVCRELKWRPKFTIEQGIHKLLEDKNILTVKKGM